MRVGVSRFGKILFVMFLFFSVSTVGVAIKWCARLFERVSIDCRTFSYHPWVLPWSHVLLVFYGNVECG